MTNIQIDYYPKGKNVFLIITGVNGSIKGYKNKYETIANNVMENYDFSVFVTTTPSGLLIYYIKSHII